jgi:hypothetical protein
MAKQVKKSVAGNSKTRKEWIGSTTSIDANTFAKKSTDNFKKYLSGTL